ncbi:hypothetical protein C4D60_Mb01t14160 [Musa balbisiana]|uniref:Uncharacterized protein n=1 Tax=Musa balbisiana TaxID=52838 RepID=A0A4S8JM49_MUSBA|nr:hypothetical protein C4D60_Mb01t14160 [Musa balbisiana]
MRHLHWFHIALPPLALLCICVNAGGGKDICIVDDEATLEEEEEVERCGADVDASLVIFSSFGVAPLYLPCLLFFLLIIGNADDSSSLSSADIDAEYCQRRLSDMSMHLQAQRNGWCLSANPQNGRKREAVGLQFELTHSSEEKQALCPKPPFYISTKQRVHTNRVPNSHFIEQLGGIFDGK